MNYFDIIVGLILVFALFKGIKKGLVIELASIAALVLGVWGAVKFSGVTESYLSEHIDSGYIGLIAFFVTFILIVIGVHILAKLVDKLVSAVALGFVNRLLGGAFSVIKYAFVISVLMAVVNGIDERIDIIPESQKESSVLYKPISDFSLIVFPYLHFDDIKEKAKSSGVVI
ncbi:MAG: CvpA family protein [Chlorobi bacterium]|nr:CvpA family protein [Chlorobiota bacterium]